MAFRPGEDFGDTFVGERRQLGVAVPGAAVVGVAGDGAAAVAGGVVEDVVDVPVDVVVREEGSADTGRAGADAGLGEVVGGGVDAVGVVVDVGAAVAVAVDTHRGPGGGHELHQPLGAGGAGVVVAAVAGFFHADAGQQGPGDLVPGGCGDVQVFDLGRDGQRRVVQRVLARPAGCGQREPHAALRRVAPMASGVGRRRLGAGWRRLCRSSGAPRSAMNGTGSTGWPLISTWKCRWSPVLVTGGSFDPEPLADRHDGSGSDLAVDAGQVGVAGADAAAVAEGDDVAVRALRCRRSTTVPAAAATTGPAAGREARSWPVCSRHCL